MRATPYSEPKPPSSQSPSNRWAHVFEQRPQSAQSVPGEHNEYSDPGPPSSQSPSFVNAHVSRSPHACSTMIVVSSPMSSRRAQRKLGEDGRTAAALFLALPEHAAASSVRASPRAGIDGE